MTPQTVNAYNNPVFNEVVFPAAILQPPFFNKDADPAINYGAIGGVIGHEMTHGFDDEGRKFDAKGQLHDWWTEEDARRFDALGKRFGAEYAAMNLPDVPGAHINPALTMGENIADLGGLTLALDAYHASATALRAAGRDRGAGPCPRPACPFVAARGGAGRGRVGPPPARGGAPRPPRPAYLPPRRHQPAACLSWRCSKATCPWQEEWSYEMGLAAEP